MGRKVIEELLHNPTVAGVEGIYLMSTKALAFTGNLDFQDAKPQHLMALHR